MKPIHWIVILIIVVVIMGSTATYIISTNGKLNDKLDDLIIRAAKKHGIDPAILKTVAQLESSIGSERGRKLEPRGQTYGLFHVRLETANWLRDLAKLPRVTFEDLANDELQADLAAQYIAYLMRLWKGDISKVMMSYNGGQGNVQRGTVSAGAQKYYQDYLKYRNMIGVA